MPSATGSHPWQQAVAPVGADSVSAAGCRLACLRLPPSPRLRRAGRGRCAVFLRIGALAPRRSAGILPILFIHVRLFIGVYRRSSAVPFRTGPSCPFLFDRRLLSFPLTFGADFVVACVSRPKVADDDARLSSPILISVHLRSSAVPFRSGSGSVKTFEEGVGVGAEGGGVDGGRRDGFERHADAVGEGFGPDTLDGGGAEDRGAVGRAAERAVRHRRPRDQARDHRPIDPVFRGRNTISDGRRIDHAQFPQVPIGRGTRVSMGGAGRGVKGFLSRAWPGNRRDPGRRRSWWGRAGKTE